MFRKRYDAEDSWRVTSETKPGSSTCDVLDEWVRSLPEGVVLDLAAGQGIESRYIADAHNRKVVAYDISDNLRKQSVYSVNRGDIFALNYGSRTYAGALIKDAWVFFDPNKRATLLEKLYNGLCTGGSVLIMSQWSDTRAHVIPPESDYPQKYLLSDYSSVSDWIFVLAKEKAGGGKVIAIEYEVSEQTFSEEANGAGFSLEIVEYRMGSALSMENRWKQVQQLVATLRK